MVSIGQPGKKDRGKAFDDALGDFQYLLQKAVDNVVSMDGARTGTSRLRTTMRTEQERRASRSPVGRHADHLLSHQDALPISAYTARGQAIDLDAFKNSHASLISKSPILLQELISKLQASDEGKKDVISVSNLLFEVKQYASKVLKGMRD